METIFDECNSRQVKCSAWSAAASAAGAGDALGQRDRHDHHDHERMEDLQRRLDFQLAAFSRRDRARDMGAERIAVALFRNVDTGAQWIGLFELWTYYGPFQKQASSFVLARAHWDDPRCADLPSQA